ncbi:MAG: Sec-independent protein translocase protein TatB [Gammaproteobacteria bacterium]
MFDIGFAELFICGIVALLVLGPERLPGAARTIGRWVGRARHTVNQFTEQIDREIRAEDVRKRLDVEMKKAGLDDVSRQVNDALKAPLALPPVIGADHLRNPESTPSPPLPADEAQRTEDVTHAAPAVPDAAPAQNADQPAGEQRP